MTDPKSLILDFYPTGMISFFFDNWCVVSKYTPWYTIMYFFSVGTIVLFLVLLNSSYIMLVQILRWIWMASAILGRYFLSNFSCFKSLNFSYFVLTSFFIQGYCKIAFHWRSKAPNRSCKNWTFFDGMMAIGSDSVSCLS